MIVRVKYLIAGAVFIMTGTVYKVRQVSDRIYYYYFTGYKRGEVYSFGLKDNEKVEAVYT